MFWGCIIAPSSGPKRPRSLPELLDTNNGDTTLLQNMGNNLPAKRAQHSTRLNSSGRNLLFARAEHKIQQSQYCKPQISHPFTFAPIYLVNYNLSN
jgi:hypothetical protein